MKLPVNMFSGRFLPLQAASSSPSDGKAQQGLIPGLKSNRSKLVVGKSWGDTSSGASLQTAKDQ